MDYLRVFTVHLCPSKISLHQTYTSLHMCLRKMIKSETQAQKSKLFYHNMYKPLVLQLSTEVANAQYAKKKQNAINIERFHIHKSKTDSTNLTATYLYMTSTLSCKSAVQLSNKSRATNTV